MPDPWRLPRLPRLARRDAVLAEAGDARGKVSLALVVRDVPEDMIALAKRNRSSAVLILDPAAHKILYENTAALLARKLHRSLLFFGVPCRKPEPTAILTIEPGLPGLSGRFAFLWRAP